MTSYATSSFAQYQVDVCEVPTEIQSDKICPTCVIDPDYIEPKWWLQTEPYLNKKTCEYSISVTINENGDYYSPSVFRQRNETIKQVMRSFVRPAVRKILTFYGKQISDDIVCAIPPSGKNNTCRSLVDIGITEQQMSNFINVYQSQTDDDRLYNVHTLSSTLQRDFPQIKNLDAVELYARATDYHFGRSTAMPMRVLVSIPAHIVDAVPDVEEIDDEGVSFEDLKSVTIRGDEARAVFKTLSLSLGSFYKFQSIFYQEEGGNIFLKTESGEQKGVLYLTSFKKSVMKVYNKLQSVLKDNGYKLSVFDSPRRPYEVKIIFDPDNSENPFNVKNIKARYEGCPFNSLKRQSVNSFNNAAKKLPYNRILMGYIANINDAYDDITARETIGWIDFLKKYTYPGISVDYGKYDPDAKSGLSCFTPDSVGLRKTVDYFLGEEFSLIDAVEYNFNKNNCKAYVDSAEQKPITAIQKMKAAYSGENHPFYKFAADAATKQFDYENSLLRSLKEMDISSESIRNFSGEGFIDKLNPCNWGEVSKKALRCLFAGLTLDEALEKITQAALEAMRPKHLGKLFIGLPVDVQLEIQAEIEREFGNMPAPWNSGYDPGSVSNVAKMPPSLALDDQRASIQADIERLEMQLISLRSQEESLLSDVSETQSKIAHLSEQIEIARLELDPTDVQTLQNLSNLRKELKTLKDILNSINGNLKPVQDEIRTKEDQLSKKKSFSGSEGTYGSELAIQLGVWEDMSEEEKQAIRDDENEYSRSLMEGKRYHPGTIGKAMGNIQQLVSARYIQLILEKVGARELLSYVDKLPGAPLLSFVIASFDCPRPGKFNPPIASFMQTLTLDPCAGAIDFDLPSLRKIPTLNRKSIIKNLVQAFRTVLEGIIDQFIYSLQLRVLETLESAICKAIGQAGNVLTGGTPDGGLLSVLQEEMCSEPLTPSQVEDVAGKMLKDLGITPNGYDTGRGGLDPNDMMGTYESIAKALGVLATSNEIKEAIVSGRGDQDQDFLEGISNALTTLFPDFSIAFDSPEKIGIIFGEMGNYLTPEQVDAIRDTIRDGEGDFPIDPSVCLTNEQRELWDEERQRLFEEAGLSPADAQDWVNNQNERNESDFYEAAKSLAESPSDQLRDKLNDALRLDPDCPPGSSAIKLEDEQFALIKDNIATSMFQNLSTAFAKDIIANGLTIGRRTWGSLGAFQFILKSKKGKNFQKIKDFEKEAPETVGIQMWKNIIEFEDNKEIEYREDTGPRKSETAFEYYDSTHEDVKSIYMKFKYFASLYRNKKKRKTLDYKVQIKSAPMVGNLTPGEGALEGLKKLAQVVGGAAAISSGAAGVFALLGAGTLSSLATIPIGLVGGIIGSVGLIGSVAAAAAVGAIVGALDKAKVDVNSMRTFNYIFRKNYHGGVKQLIDKNDITQSELDEYNIPYQSRLFANYLNSSLEPMGGRLSSQAAHSRVFVHLNTLLFNDFFKKLFLNRKDKRSRGFNYGYDAASKITYKDLLYVDPTADPDDESTWEYTIPEELAILGKSATENPRVRFLDPSQHGGTFKNPKIYVERAQHGGWLSFMEVMLPEINKCRKKDTDFLDFNDIAEKTRDVEKNTPVMKELSYEPECVIELPFNKIASPSTHGYLEGAVVSTIRVFITEFIIKCWPIFSNVRMGNNNYGDLADFIIERMEDEMSEMAPFVPIAKIQREAYWLLFLEQAVQSVQRKLDSGELEYNEEIDRATSRIRRLQKNYVQPNFRPHVTGLAKWNVAPDSIGPVQRRIIDGALICGFGKQRKTIWGGLFTASAEERSKIKLKTKLFTLENARFACKVGAIDDVRSECKVLLKYLIEEQLQFFQDKLDKRLPVQPRIYDVSKYFLGGSDVFFGPELNAGLSSVERPYTGGQANVGYGNVFHVSKDVNTHNPLDGHIHKVGKFEDAGEPHIRKGGLILEKYLRIVDRKPTLFASDRFMPSPRYMSERSGNLKEIVNIKEFQQFLKDNSDKFGEGDYISTVLGTAAIVYDENDKPVGYQGSVGIKYGVRISYVAPEGLSPFAGSLSTEQRKTAQQHKAFKLKRANVTIESEDGGQNSISLPGSSFIVPLASYEKDVLDRRLKDIDLNDDDFGEDLKCYIDKLVETDEFKFLFDVCIPVNRSSFMAAFYSYNTLISSIFKDPSEFDIKPGQVDEESEEMTDEDAPDLPIGDNLLDRAKEEARQLFRAFYQKDDSTEGDDIQSTEDSNYNKMIRNMAPAVFMNFDTRFRTRPKFWQLARIEDRPTDDEGEPCKSVFQQIFEQD